MSEILEHIMARRSIRKYTEEPVSREQLEMLLRAAMAAPSASNLRPWEFVVVTDPERLARLRRVSPFAAYNAPAAIIVCGNMRRVYPPPATGFWIQDCSAATQNILLAATGLGLGSVWIGIHPVPTHVALVRRVINPPRHVVPLSMVYVGHPARPKAPRTQYDEARVHWEEYDRAVTHHWWQFWRRRAPSEGDDQEG